MQYLLLFCVLLWLQLDYESNWNNDFVTVVHRISVYAHDFNRISVYAHDFATAIHTTICLCSTSIGWYMWFDFTTTVHRFICLCSFIIFDLMRFYLFDSCIFGIIYCAIVLFVSIFVCSFSYRWQSWEITLEVIFQQVWSRLSSGVRMREQGYTDGNGSYSSLQTICPPTWPSDTESASAGNATSFVVENLSLYF